MVQQSKPFQFYTERRLVVLTGEKASNLKDLLSLIKTVPGSSIFYHTHRFLLQHHYVTGPNLFVSDFALWVADALQEDLLAEKLNSVDLLEFTSIRDLRDRVAGLLEEHLAQDGEGQDCPPGEEFYFCCSKSFCLPTSFKARNLTEFVECLSRVTVHSIFFHLVEARLRLGHPSNDFSVWMGDALQNHDLSEAISKLDPYVNSLEDIRSDILALVGHALKSGDGGRGS